MFVALTHPDCNSFCLCYVCYISLESVKVRQLPEIVTRATLQPTRHFYIYTMTYSIQSD